MAQLAPAIAEIIILEHGRSTFLQRLSDPYWFQAFGCVLGFDWHSSGVTTTVCGALKEGLAPREHELGIFVAGGKGKVSRRTPAELLAYGDRLGMDGARLAYNSRMAAKVDSAAVQDGFGIYHHSFFLTSEGEWSVVAMNADGSRGVSVDARVGARIPSLRGFAIGLLAAGALALLMGAGLTYLGIRSPRATVKGSRR